jgi:hypothetical protein
MDRFTDSFLSEVSPDKALQHRIRAEVILGRSLLAKHLAGQHDQSTHGSWAGESTGLELIDKLISPTDTPRDLARKLIVANGMNTPPQVAESSEDFDSKVLIELWRGFDGYVNSNTLEIGGYPTTEDYVDGKVSSFLESKTPYISEGKWGAGLYTATKIGGTDDFARQGKVVQMGLKRGANIMPYFQDADEKYNNFESAVKKKYPNHPALSKVKDIATAYGIINKYDAMYIANPTDYTSDGDYYSVWNAGSLIVNPSTIPNNLVAKHLAGQHDQSSHGSWAGTETTRYNAGNGLSPSEMIRQNSGTDSLREQIYDAEIKFRGIEFDMDSKPQRGNFDSWEDYESAHNKWAKEQVTLIVTPTGEKYLDGTRKGVVEYVNAVGRSDWFVEKFGNGGSIGFPDVKVRKNSPSAGFHQVTRNKSTGAVKNFLQFDSNYSRSEPTIMHELAHFATLTNETKQHQGHGVEFARNHLYIIEKMQGIDSANRLRDFYVAQGVPLND